jgi:hypothetical protein
MTPPDGESWWDSVLGGGGIISVALSLPKPAGKFLYVQVGSEVNRGRDFFCTDGSPLAMEDVAAKYATFILHIGMVTGRHDGDAHVVFAAAPVAETSLKVFGCCAQPPCAEDQEGASGIDFLRAMRDSYASAYLDNVEWHASHGSYQSELAVIGRPMQVLVTSGSRDCASTSSVLSV